MDPLGRLGMVAKAQCTDSAWMPPDVLLETGHSVITTCRFTNPSNADVRYGENTDEVRFEFAGDHLAEALACEAPAGRRGVFLRGLFGS